MRALTLCVLACACGGASAAAPTVTEPLSAEEALLYDNGVDFIADPAALEGQWRRDWSDDLDGRVTSADIVALVKVATLRTDTDPSRRLTYRLVLEGDDAIIGSLPDELSLRVLQSDSGFNSVDGNDRRILDQDFVLFAKYEVAEGDTEIRARWHLSPATEDIVSRVEYLAERRRGVERVRPNRTVVIHRAE